MCDQPLGGGGGHRRTNGTPCHIQHSPGTPTTGLRERGNDTGRSTGRSGRQNATTRRNMRREERVTVQGPVKKQQPDGMSQRGGGASVRCGPPQSALHVWGIRRPAKPPAASLSQVLVGEAYRTGQQGVARSLEQAESWFTKAKDQKSHVAFRGLGLVAMDRNDVTEAVKWYRAGAKEGDPTCKYNLGNLYLQGLGDLPPDTDIALKWFERAAEGGDLQGMCNAGLMYMDGPQVWGGRGTGKETVWLGRGLDLTRIYWVLAGRKTEQSALHSRWRHDMEVL